MALISISIDISGSTKIKKTIKDFCSADPENIKSSYLQFIRQLYNCEMDFYLQLANHGIDMTNLFVVKTIGDEIWIVLDVEKCHAEFQTPVFNRLVSAVLQGLIHISYKKYYMVVSERGLTPAEINNPDRIEKVRYKYLPIIPRVFVDLLENYEEANHIRYEILERRYHELVPLQNIGGANISEVRNDFPMYLSNLNFGSQVQTSGKNKVRVSHRFDPIGFEIDQFFRCSQHSRPGIVAVGESLFRKMMLDIKFSSLKNKGRFDKLKIPGMEGATSVKYLTCLYKKLSEQDMKGINEDYYLFYLFNKAMLPSGITGKRGERMSYKSTLELFKEFRLRF